MSEQKIIQSFSSYIFWDVDKASVNPVINAPFIVQRVLEYGQISDWRLLVDLYGLDTIVDTAKRLRSLDPKALSFICTITNTSPEEFRCYNTKHSSHQLWSF